MGTTKTVYSGSGSCFPYCCCPLCCVTLTRKEIREGYNIEGSIVNDCLLSMCCPLCVAVQLRAEVNERNQQKGGSGQVETTAQN